LTEGEDRHAKQTLQKSNHISEKSPLLTCAGFAIPGNGVRVNCSRAMPPSRQVNGKRPMLGYAWRASKKRLKISVHLYEDVGFASFGQFWVMRDGIGGKDGTMGNDESATYRFH
jgi:hypothetical protein